MSATGTSVGEGDRLHGADVGLRLVTQQDRTPAYLARRGFRNVGERPCSFRII